jgi:Asparagine synthase (glutamine-hydrolyzing)
MGFIYGILSIGKNIDLPLIKRLEDAFILNNFTSKQLVENNLAIGMCWNQDKSPNCEIITNSEYTLIADIRLYNTKQLQKIFNFKTPAGAFLEAYKRWGNECANHLNGDFSIFLFDKTTRKATLFRDHIGARPLTYFANDEMLAFASHEFGIARAGIIPLKFSPRTVLAKLLHLSEEYTLTPFIGVLKLTPGHYFEYSQNQTKITKYWKPENITKDRSLTLEDSISSLRKLLIDATCSRSSGENIGVHVSGGLDSTGIASILADFKSNARIVGYSWTPKEHEPLAIKQIDETSLIQNFIENKKVEVKFIDGYGTIDKYKETIIPEFEVQCIELPIMKMAKDDAIDTLYSGWGGDEFCSSGLKGTLSHLLFRLKWITLLKYIRAKGWRNIAYISAYEVFEIIPPFSTIYSLNKIRWRNLKYFKISTIAKELSYIIIHRPKWPFSIKGKNSLMLNFIKQHHLANRMDSWAINAEKYGFEYRYPLLDKDIIEFWFSIPTKYTYHNFLGRYIFREVLKGILPEKIRNREDKGEALRITNTLRLRINAAEHAINAIEDNKWVKVTPFFNHQKFAEKADECKRDHQKTKSYKPWAFFVFTTYFRYCLLYKEFFLNIRNRS